MASQDRHCSSGRCAHSSAAAATKLGCRTMTSSNAPAGAPMPVDQASQSNAGACWPSAAPVISV